MLKKNQLKQLVLEEYNKIKEQQNVSNQSLQQQNQKQILKQNVSQQIRLLRFMKETLKQTKVPQELTNMIEYIKKAKTSDFLSQVLNVEKSIPVNISAVLINPIGLLQSIIDEVLKSAVQKANQKLAEGKEEYNNLLEEELGSLEEDFHFGHEEDKRLEKHKKKEMKKHKNNDIPPVNLSPEDMKKFIELKNKK